MKVSEKKIILATHQMVYGVPHALKDYLISKKTKKLLYLGFPLLFNRHCSYFLYTNGKQVMNRDYERKTNLGLLDHLIDFFQLCWWLITLSESYDLFIGFDCLTVFAGLFFKKIGRSKKVIFYTMDFTPGRFKNSFINFMYHAIEKFTIYHSDEVWDVSPRMEEGRKEFFNISSSKYKRRIVPVGIWEGAAIQRSLSQIKRHQVLFMGTLYEKQGVQLILDALPKIVKKIADVRFLIIGGGEYEKSLKLQVKKLKIEKYVEFSGWITNRKQIDSIMGESACAIATYKPEKKRMFNFSYYADPYKLKDYLAAGLPIIVTDVPYMAQKIADHHCGILVDYNKKSVEKALTKFLTDDNFLKQYKKNAYEYSKQFRWKDIYDEAFDSV